MLPNGLLLLPRCEKKNDFLYMCKACVCVFESRHSLLNFKENHTRNSCYRSRVQRKYRHNQNICRAAVYIVHISSFYEITGKFFFLLIFWQGVKCYKVTNNNGTCAFELALLCVPGWIFCFFFSLSFLEMRRIIKCCQWWWAITIYYACTHVY